MIVIFKNRIDKINDDTFNIKTIIHLIQMYLKNRKSNKEHLERERGRGCKWVNLKFSINIYMLYPILLFSRDIRSIQIIKWVIPKNFKYVKS